MYLYRSLVGALITFVPFASLASACNGHASLCSRSYSNVTFLVTHDSYASGNNIAATQNYPIQKQLDDGVRGLKLSPVISIADQNQATKVHLCHTHCEILDAGSAVQTLDEIADWLSHHPNEVLTIMWNNLYNLNIEQLAAAYKASRIMPYIYTHNQTVQWPTLQDMILSGQRVVNFVDSVTDPTAVPWLHDQFSFVFETPYDNRDVDSFKCVIDRPQNPPNEGKELLYVMNHFLYGVIQLGTQEIQMPQKDRATVVNEESLQNHAQNCAQTFGRMPNFIEVDFYNQGNALAIVAAINGVPAPVIESQKEADSASTLRTQTGEDLLHRLIPTPPFSRIVIRNSADRLQMTKSLLWGVIISMLINIMY